MFRILTLCAATLSNIHVLQRLHCVHLRYVATPMKELHGLRFGPPVSVVINGFYPKQGLEKVLNTELQPLLSGVRTFSHEGKICPGW
jgi:hypothetical protein